MYLQAGSSANSLYTAHASNVVLEWQPITRDDPSCHADGCRDPGCWSQKFRQKRRANATCRCGVLPPSCQSFSGLPSWRVSYGRTDVCCFRQSSQISQLTSSMKEHCSRTILLCCLHTSGYGRIAFLALPVATPPQAMEKNCFQTMVFLHKVYVYHKSHERITFHCRNVHRPILSIGRAYSVAGTTEWTRHEKAF